MAAHTYGDSPEERTYAGGPAALEVDDEIIWDGRANPLTVIEAAHQDREHSDTEEVAVKGPRGGVVTLSKSVRSRSWKTSSDGRVDSVYVVSQADREPVSAGRDKPFQTEWGGPTDDCPHCGTGDDNQFRSEDFRCHYVHGGLWGGHDGRPVERTDAGMERTLVRAQCTTCGGVVYEHPAYAMLFGGDRDSVGFPPEHQ
ncbi:hypothetical protein HLRTI_002925 [Halorhabdus tiamatea SARL4B]|uniref:Uncharacterized protein n=1 Tax=Halorhabdus tiamatea SARL4B TaxID=1033806 RepID=U2DZB0_9EURY|nr:hypothetical protein [Halorhabdus tiamatea]ERJ05126.1 hypothetical protein HLRTI_002925 [Halorhabdus tiamatea SARL4B]